MENIAVSLIVNGQFKNVVMPSDLVGELVVKLREEGVCGVHFASESVACEGIVVLAKGSKNQIMVFANKD